MDRLPYALFYLRRLHISCINLGVFFDLSFALCLIRSSPNLEEIEIEVVNEVYFSLSFSYVFDFLMIFNFKSRLMVFLIFLRTILNMRAGRLLMIFLNVSRI